VVVVVAPRNRDRLLEKMVVQVVVALVLAITADLEILQLLLRLRETMAATEAQLPLIMVLAVVGEPVRLAQMVQATPEERAAMEAHLQFLEHQ
jgi:uncharacterized protein YecA (UPF0149 family)